MSIGCYTLLQCKDACSPVILGYTYGMKLVKDPSSPDPYLRHGFPNREMYLRDCAQSYGIPLKTVRQIADMLGAIEDFDALPLHLEEYSWLDMS